MDTETAYDILLRQELTKRLEEQLTPEIEHNTLAATMIDVLQEYFGAEVTPEQAQVIKANDSDSLKWTIGRIGHCDKDIGIDGVLSFFGMRHAVSPAFAELTTDSEDQLIPKLKQETLAATLIRLLTLHFGAQPTPEQAEAVKSTGSAQLMDAIGRMHGINKPHGIDGALLELNIGGYDSFPKMFKLLFKKNNGQLTRQIEQKTLAETAIHLLQLRNEVQLTPEQAQVVKSAVPEHLKHVIGEIGRLPKSDVAADGVDSDLRALKMTMYDNRLSQRIIEERLTPKIEQKTLAALALELLSERIYFGEDLTAEKAQAIQAADLSRLKSGIGDIALWKTVRLDGALDALGIGPVRARIEAALAEHSKQIEEQAHSKLAELAIRVMEEYYGVKLTREQESAIRSVDSERLTAAIPKISTFDRSLGVDAVLRELGFH